MENLNFDDVNSVVGTISAKIAAPYMFGATKYN